MTPARGVGLIASVLAGLIALGAAGYLGYGLLLWRFQEVMIFPAPGGIGTDSLDSSAREIGAEPIRLQAADGTALYGWYKEALTGSPGKKAVLYLHGNAETVAAPGPLMRLANQNGWDFAVVAFRGYPGSEGSPSEVGLAEDADALWAYVTDVRHVPARNVVIHGRSLGGAVAVGLAERVDPGALVVESSFRSMLEMARTQAPIYPVDRLLRHPFDTWSRAPRIDVPTLVLHGDADTIVPVDHGRSLAERFASAQYVEVPGGHHNELLVLRDPSAKRAWLDLLSTVGAGEE